MHLRAHAFTIHTRIHARMHTRTHTHVHTHAYSFSPSHTFSFSHTHTCKRTLFRERSNIQQKPRRGRRGDTRCASLCRTVFWMTTRARARQICAARTHKHMHSFDIYTHEIARRWECQVTGYDDDYTTNTVGKVCLIAAKVSEDAT